MTTTHTTAHDGSDDHAAEQGNALGVPGTEATRSVEQEELLARLRAAGLSLSDLATSGLIPPTTAGAPTLAVLVPEALAALKRQSPGTHGTWSPYLNMLIDGLPELCPCPCERCSTGPCPCTSGDAHHSGCTPPAGEQLNCTDRYEHLADRAVTAVLPADIEDLAWWAQRKALKRTVARNAKRRAKGDPPHQSDGRGAAESAIQGTRWFFTRMIDNDVATKNPAARVKVPARQERLARSLEVAELLEVYRTAVTTGDDPELDGLLLRHSLIHATRRGGLLGATAGGANAREVTLTYWDPKRKTYRTRPSTKAHLAHLYAHMPERGPRIAAPPDAPPEVRRTGVPNITDADPMFYRRPIDTFDADGFLVSRTVRPVTRKHIEVLFDRIKRHLPWARMRGLRPHDLRHTSARLVYQAADQQLARLHLAHDAGSTTDHYLTAQLKELAKLNETLFGMGDLHRNPDETGAIDEPGSGHPYR